MRRTRTTELIIEIEELLVVSPARASVRGAECGWCEGCGSVAYLLAPEVAAAASGVSARQVYRLVESGALHFVEKETGELLVCLSSLGDGRDLSSRVDAGDASAGGRALRVRAREPTGRTALPPGEE